MMTAGSCNQNGKPFTSSFPLSSSYYYYFYSTAQEKKFSIKDFFSKCNQIRSFLRIWSNSLKKFLMENFIFCAV